MRRQRSYRPATESLETRAVPTLVLLADIDSGYGAPDAPLPAYVEHGVNFLAPGAGSADTMGPGGHGTAMADMYASTLAKFGVAAHVVPIVACGPTSGPLSWLMPFSYTTDAIGKAELWVANQQAMMRAQGRDVQWIVSLPAEPHGNVGLLETFGRRALDAAGIPIVQAGGNNGWYGSPLLFDHSATSIVAASNTDTPYRAPFLTYCVVPPYAGSSGATMVSAAYLTATIYGHRDWSMAWDVFDVRARGVLGA